MAGVQDIYVALFGRPADPEGLTYWNQVTGNGANLSKMLAALPSTAEYTTRFAGQSSEQIVASVYQSLFGRAPDAAGLKFFADRLASGEQTIATIAVNIAQGAQGTDKQTFAAKVNAADLFTKSLDTPAEIAAYKGDAAAKAAQGFLSTVDKDRPASQDAVDKAVVGVVTGGVLPGGGGGGGSGAPTTVVTTALGFSFEQGALDPLVVGAKDPLFGSQWYLNNAGQRGGNGPHHDMKVIDAWLQGYTGKGIKVAINDDGIDLGHEAYKLNILQDLTYNSVTQKYGPNVYSAVPLAERGHGTVVGSIVGMRANDNIGMVGVAPDASLVSGLALANNANIPKLYEYLVRTADVDVSVNSFGKDPAFSENFYDGPGTTISEYDLAYLKSIEEGGQRGRGGLGIINEVSAGNERPQSGDAGMTGTTNNKYVITVGAVKETGERASYSTAGASVLVSAFGGEDTNPDSDDKTYNKDVGYALATADLTGDLSVPGNYNFNSFGTSYSGPIVGAAAALMLQANPLLGFRDVANILAMTARQLAVNPDPDNPLVKLNGNMVNFDGLSFSRGIGFGVVDIAAAVRLAASWVEQARTDANWLSSEGASPAGEQVIASNGIDVTATLTQNVIIERMEFDLKLEANKPSKLKAEIISPSGTTITLFDKPLAGEITNGVIGTDKPWPGIFQIGATAFLGENSAGKWTLKLTNTDTGEVAKYQSLTVRAWGSPTTENSQYVLTDAFGLVDKVVTDHSGIDLINGAALSLDAVIDLNAGAISRVGGTVIKNGTEQNLTTTTTGGGTFKIAAGTNIENAFGGAGADTLIGNALGNVLRGNGGGDTLTGNGGSDLFMFTTVNDSYAQARDKITDFELGVDKIDMRLLDANTNLAGNQDFVFGGQGNTVRPNGIVFAFEGGDTIIRADLNGDSQAEVEILLVGEKQLTAGDFLGLVA